MSSPPARDELDCSHIPTLLRTTGNHQAEEPVTGLVLGCLGMIFLVFCLLVGSVILNGGLFSSDLDKQTDY